MLMLIDITLLNTDLKDENHKIFEMINNMILGSSENFQIFKKSDNVGFAFSLELLCKCKPNDSPRLYVELLTFFE